MAEYEAIVRDIQQGSREKLPELWEDVRPFAARQANRRMTAYREHNSDYAIDTEDLIQEGFFALLRALETYQSGGRMSFLGWWELYLKTAYNEALGLRWKRKAQAPDHQCVSLSLPLSMDGGGTLEDLIPDNRNSIEAAEVRIWRGELRAAVDSALAALPEHLRALIAARYLQGQTLQTMAAAAGGTTQGISDKTHRALKRLRKQDRAGRLAKFVRQI